MVSIAEQLFMEGQSKGLEQGREQGREKGRGDWVGGWGCGALYALSAQSAGGKGARLERRVS